MKGTDTRTHPGAGGPPAAGDVIPAGPPDNDITSGFAIGYG